MPKELFKTQMTGLRDECKNLLEMASDQKKLLIIAGPEAFDEGQDKSEMIANVILAIRHIEDASMRFGKAIQASEGGVSPLGGPNTPK